MELVRFKAIDPYAPAATEEELEQLIPRLRDVIDWTIHPDGNVVIEYDNTQISYELIEDVLGRLGFRVTHITDFPVVDEMQAREALGYDQSFERRE